MPVPSRRFKTEVVLGSKVPGPCPKPTNGQETGADDHMKAMEPRRQIERR